MRDYFVKRMDYAEEHRGKDCLARDVIVTDETIDIGITDQFGNKIVARRRHDPVGFIRFPER